MATLKEVKEFALEQIVNSNYSSEQAYQWAGVYDRLCSAEFTEASTERRKNGDDEGY